MKPSGKTRSGISLIGDMPWGTSCCHFYQTDKDLLDVFLPYLKTGLENNESCVWVVSGRFSRETAIAALATVVPDTPDFLESGQLEIVSDSDWYNGSIKNKETLISRLDSAVARGFNGLRLAIGAFPRREDGDDADAAAVFDTVGRHNVITVFAYPRDKFGAVGLLRNCRHVLIHDAGKLEAMEISEAKTTRDNRRISGEKWTSLFSHMAEGFAYHRIVLDESGRPCDYTFLEVNDAFQRLTGLKAKDIIGRRATEVIPGIEKDPVDWIGKYGQVALTGEPTHFESYSEAVSRWYSVSAFSPHKGFFAVTLSDITDRKKSRDELLRAKLEWERTFDNVPDLIAIIDTQYNITRVNRAMADRLGVAPEECIGRRCYEVVHGFAQPPDYCPHSLTCRDFRVHTSEVNEPNLGGDFLISTTPVFDEAGRLTGVTHVARDITESKRAEQLLVENEHRLERSQELAHLGSWELDLSDNTITWSDEVHRIFGIKPGEFEATYEAFLEAVHPDDRRLVDDAYSGSLRDGRDAYEIEHRVVRRASGEIRYVYEKCEHVRDETGNVVKSLGMVHDITGHKKAEEAISHLASFPELNPNPIIELDAAGKVSYLNPAAKTLFPDLVALGGRHPFLKDVFAAIQQGQTHPVTKDIKIGDCWYEQAMAYVPSSQSYRLYVRDNTGRQQAEEELRRINAELEVSNRELEAFSYSVSHDLRGPLRSMEGFSNALLEDYADRLGEEGRKYLDYVRESSELMARLIDDLLKLSRVTRSDMSYDSVDLSAIARKIMADSARAEPQRAVKLDIAPNIIAYGDRNLLRLALENLLGNAWKFTGKAANPRIEFGTLTRDGEIVYLIGDNGVGFDMTYADKLYNPFQRLHKSSDFSGTGIGLATVQRIIRRHGGRVWAESRPGEGATFYFTLS